jgi:hypothetical protein
MPYKREYVGATPAPSTQSNRSLPLLGFYSPKALAQARALFFFELLSEIRRLKRISDDWEDIIPDSSLDGTGYQTQKIFSNILKTKLASTQKLW